MSFYIEQGYPAPAVQYYLRGLANGRLAEMPLAEALAAPIRLSECGTAGPLVDTVKLDDISGDYIATLSGEQILTEVSTWARSYDPALAEILEAERALALRALAVERDDVPNPRKDLRKWPASAVPTASSSPQIFAPVADPADARFGGLAPELVRAVADAFAARLPAAPAGRRAGRRLVRTRSARLAADLGFAPSRKDYKQNPAAYPGSIIDASQVIRVLVTGGLRSPDLAEVSRALGADEVLRRVRAVATAKAPVRSVADSHSRRQRSLSLLSG